jgi:hypothetical protein
MAIPETVLLAGGLVVILGSLHLRVASKPAAGLAHLPSATFLALYRTALRAGWLVKPIF